MSLGDAALRYAQAGVPIFPLAPRGKVPLTANGVYAATTDLHQIRTWWERTPQANIGMPTGESSGWDVLDIDVPAKNVERGRSRRSGWEVVRPALDTGLLAQPVMTIRTPSGGSHLYYLYSPDARNGAMSDYGLDYRGQGGYVVVPPSKTPSGTYVIVHQPDPARRDNQCDFAALRRLIQRAEQPPDPTRLRNFGPTTPETLQRRVEGLIRTVLEAKVGTRNNVLYWAARVAVEEDLGGLNLLYEAAQTAGLGAEESAKTIQSALRGPTHALPSAPTDPVRVPTL